MRATDWKFTWEIDGKLKARYVYCDNPRMTKVYRDLKNSIVNFKIERV